MSATELKPVINSWELRIENLEAKRQRVIGRRDGDGSTDAVLEELEPKIKKETVEDCLNDLVASEDLDDVLESLADWRSEADEYDKRIRDSNEWFRKSNRRIELERCVDELSDGLDESIFRSCGLCGSYKMPTSDKRRRSGYRWECPECGV